ncbi:MAG: hypothetical protein ACI97A_004258, partial [Planctomycetota bacterium]
RSASTTLGSALPGSSLYDSDYDFLTFMLFLPSVGVRS